MKTLVNPTGRKGRPLGSPVDHLQIISLSDIFISPLEDMYAVYLGLDGRQSLD